MNIFVAKAKLNVMCRLIVPPMDLMERFQY